ncbi:MAG: hypothetical protein ABJD24_14010 [Acidimicrobiales bacterium]
MSGDEAAGSGPAADAAHDARELLNGILDEMNAGYRAMPGTRSTSDGEADVVSTARGAGRVTLNGLVDLVTELAELGIRVVGKIAVEVTNAAAELVQVIARRAGDGSLSDPLRLSVGGAVPEPAPVLVLPDVSPGQTTTSHVSVRNDTLDMIDGMRLRCGGLFGPGEERILGYRLDFTPPVVDVRPRTTVNVACSIVVPSDTKRARYFGVIEVAGTPGLQLLVSLNVI